MITQKFKNGESEIRIESAESQADATTNGFPEGNYSRYFINDKPVDSYFAIINHIIDSTKKGGAFKTPTKDELLKLQKDVIENQKKAMREQMEMLKKQYASIKLPDEVLAQFDKIFESIDLVGVRVAQ